MSERRVHLCVSGLVQGVYYRLTMQKMAAMHGVAGWVRNMEDGSVEGVIEGKQDNVAKILEWCAKGSEGARVDNVKADEQEPTGEFESFDIRD